MLDSLETSNTCTKANKEQLKKRTNTQVNGEVCLKIMMGEDKNAEILKTSTYRWDDVWIT